jgi:hypothetical protein
MNPDPAPRTLALPPPSEEHVMEWLALCVWILIALLALPVALGALSGALGLGLQAVAAIGGVVFCALFILLDGPEWAGWLAVGMAGLGVVTDLWGAERLLSDERPAVAGLQDVEELEAGILGVQIPLFGVALILSVCLGLGVATIN